MLALSLVLTHNGPWQWTRRGAAMQVWWGALLLELWQVVHQLTRFHHATRVNDLTLMGLFCKTFQYWLVLEGGFFFTDIFAIVWFLLFFKFLTFYMFAPCVVFKIVGVACSQFIRTWDAQTTIPYLDKGNQSPFKVKKKKKFLLYSMACKTRGCKTAATYFSQEYKKKKYFVYLWWSINDYRMCFKYFYKSVVMIMQIVLRYHCNKHQIHKIAMTREHEELLSVSDNRWQWF